MNVVIMIVIGVINANYVKSCLIIIKRCIKNYEDYKYHLEYVKETEKCFMFNRVKYDKKVRMTRDY